MLGASVGSSTGAGPVDLRKAAGGWITVLPPLFRVSPDSRSS